MTAREEALEAVVEAARRYRETCGNYKFWAHRERDLARLWIALDDLNALDDEDWDRADLVREAHDLATSLRSAEAKLREAEAEIERLNEREKRMSRAWRKAEGELERLRHTVDAALNVFGDRP